MACRCQERRAAIKRAAEEKTVKAAVKATGFVASTLVQDVRRVIVLKRKIAG